MTPQSHIPLHITPTTPTGTDCCRVSKLILGIFLQANVSNDFSFSFNLCVCQRSWWFVARDPDKWLFNKTIIFISCNVPYDGLKECDACHIFSLIIFISYCKRDFLLTFHWQESVWIGCHNSNNPQLLASYFLGTIMGACVNADTFVLMNRRVRLE